MLAIKIYIVVLWLFCLLFVSLLYISPFFGHLILQFKNSSNQRQHQRVLQQSQHTTTTSPTFQIEQGDIQVRVRYDDDECDKSKCISYGLYDHFNNSFTCYTDDDNYPMICADGYQPQVIKNEATVSHYGNLYHYFTCCPPNPSS